MIYLLSGLGADERVFKELEILKGRAHKFIKWEIPHEDDLKSYSERLLVQIDEDDEIVLIGVSFGGMIATEISEMIVVKKTILISSSRNRWEIPKIYRHLGKRGLIKLLPNRLLKQSNCVTNWLFGVEKPGDKKLLRAILKDTDPIFLKWALLSIANWNRNVNHAELVQIHGDRDRILPPKSHSEIKIVKGGGHLMILDKSEEVNELLRKELE